MIATQSGQARYQIEEAGRRQRGGTSIPAPPGVPMAPATVKNRTRVPQGVAVGLAVLVIFAIFEPVPDYSVRYALRDQLLENVDLVASTITSAFDPRRRIGFILLGGLGVTLLAFSKRGQCSFNHVTSWAWLGLLGWAALSVVWSDDPALTLRRVMVLGIISIGALGVGTRLSFANLAWMAWWEGVLIIAGGLAAELALGTFHPGGSDYRFSGLLNPIDTAFTATVMILAAALLSAGKPPWIRWTLALSCVVGGVVLMATRSRAPTAACAAGLLTFAALTWPRRRTVVALLICLAVGGSVLLISGDNIIASAPDLALMGRSGADAGTLTGRLPLWHYAWNSVAERPLLGFGYDSFWTADRFVATAYATGFYVADIHNSLYNLLLGLGVPGVLLGSAVMFGAIAAAAASAKNAGSRGAAFACSLLVAQFIHGLLVTHFLVEHFTSFVAAAATARIAYTSALPAERQDS